MNAEYWRINIHEWALHIEHRISKIKYSYIRCWMLHVDSKYPVCNIQYWILSTHIQYPQFSIHYPTFNIYHLMFLIQDAWSNVQSFNTGHSIVSIRYPIKFLIFNIQDSVVILPTRVHLNAIFILWLPSIPFYAHTCIWNWMSDLAYSLMYIAGCPHYRCISSVEYYFYYVLNIK